MKNKSNRVKIFVAVTYVLMVAANYLANAIPLNGVTAGEVSDKYANLFAPTGLTFSIWGLIYLMLGLYVLYQFGFWQKDKGNKRAKLMDDIGVYFIISSLLNAGWIFAWHYDYIWLSVLIIIGMLICLIKIADRINLAMVKEKFNTTECLLLWLPFSIYFGWITVAVIANIAVWLVSIGWDGWGLGEAAWAVIIIIIGAVIGMARAIKDKNIPYLMVFVWAYIGIWIKHSTEAGFAGQYPQVINAVTVCLMVLMVIVGWLGYDYMRKNCEECSM